MIIKEFVTPTELAILFGKTFADIISRLMSLGIMVSISQQLDAFTIKELSKSFGIDVEVIESSMTVEERRKHVERVNSPRMRGYEI